MLKVGALEECLEKEGVHLVQPEKSNPKGGGKTMNPGKGKKTSTKAPSHVPRDPLSKERKAATVWASGVRREKMAQVSPDRSCG